MYVLDKKNMELLTKIPCLKSSTFIDSKRKEKDAYVEEVIHAHD